MSESRELADLGTIASVLQIFGMSSVEWLVYLAGLQVGVRPASIIAKKAGIKRGQAYNVLENLIDKGIVGEITKDGVRHFSSIEPEELLSRLERRERELASEKDKLTKILPQLKNLSHAPLKRPKVRFMRGMEGIKNLYEEILNNATKEIYAVNDYDGGWESVDSSTHKWLCDWVRRRAERQLFFRGIIAKSEMADTLFSETTNSNRELKMLRDVRLPAAIFAYDTHVAITTMGEHSVAAVIESEAIAQTVIVIHRELWKHLPAYRLD